MFCYRFDVLGDPVISREHGWIGPYIRGDRHTIDAGKVGVYEGAYNTLYDSYSIPCRAWIWLNGLKYHGG